ncbi:alpha-L-rhamnosidase C-terminal domain-containing protein [Streptomyces sp. NPDC002130]|uniref:alpha-L-rhamnosidase C-terminal domain-containing protein n=1 Tax=Streptomyces sp. NPDC002130 TaxID=3155568 RepID=UPI00332435A4
MRITHVAGSHVSPYGEIRIEWQVTDGGAGLSYEAVVPANSEATLRLPALSADAVHEGRTPLTRVDGIRFTGHAEGVASYRLPSSTYRLTTRLR